MNKKLFILLPVHNRKVITEKFIKCLNNQTFKNYFLILIDDGSTDGTSEMVTQQIEYLVVIKGKGNWWWGGSLHQGYLWLFHKSNILLHDDIVLIINDDTEIENDFLENGVNLISHDSQNLLLAQCYCQETNEILDSGIHIDWEKFSFQKPKSLEEVNCLSTMGLFLKAKDFFEIGGFHPYLLPHFLSDYEFTTRAYRRGFKLITNPLLKLWVNKNTTWNKKFDNKNLLEYMKWSLSKRSPENPIYMISFIILASPKKYYLKHIYNVIKYYLKKLQHYNVL